MVGVAVVAVDEAAGFRLINPRAGFLEEDASPSLASL